LNTGGEKIPQADAEIFPKRVSISPHRPASAMVRVFMGARAPTGGYRVGVTARSVAAQNTRSNTSQAQSLAAATEKARQVGSSAKNAVPLIQDAKASGNRELNQNDLNHLHRIYQLYEKGVHNQRYNEAVEVNPAEINKAVADIKAYIQSLPNGPDPANLTALYWSIDQLGKNWGKGHFARIPGFRENSDIIQCNYFIASAYLLGAKVKNWPTGGFSGNNPIDANHLATKDIEVDYTKVVTNPRPGDIVAFHSSSTNGHATLFVGGNLVIYAGGSGIAKIETIDYVMQDGHDHKVVRKYIPNK
jgi:cell wall-associated NlpC family hydrolase